MKTEGGKVQGFKSKGPAQPPLICEHLWRSCEVLGPPVLTSGAADRRGSQGARLHLSGGPISSWSLIAWAGPVRWDDAGGKAQGP